MQTHTHTCEVSAVRVDVSVLCSQPVVTSSNLAYFQIITTCCLLSFIGRICRMLCCMVLSMCYTAHMRVAGYLCLRVPVGVLPVCAVGVLVWMSFPCVFVVGERGCSHVC